MRFASVTHDEQPLAVKIDDDRAIPLRGITELGRDTPASLLREPPLDADAAVRLSEVRWRPVIPRPGKVICIGLNYLAHIAETHREESEYPVLFTKFASSLTGAYDDIPRPPESGAVDYEGELLVVIGERGRRVRREQALQCVAGYAVANDITMRDYQYKTHQWLQGKAWDAATPIGPWLVSADEVGDVSKLTLRTKLNDQVVQEASMELMIFDIATLVATISEFTALEPGDLILTGTPSGVGFRRNPQLLLGDGDVVVVEVEGVGRLENRIVDER
ncbi:MAG: fumarylacetoacetate hydrolase family protein [Solirubrobacterales bacterium]|nr:fumarylacetoacetate hydrolase family protein [Solirubrobacterales bacterium]MBV9716005.1 fumarylacetoacetate hydrolase family protein [Solirubrobacterales bacterium]